MTTHRILRLIRLQIAHEVQRFQHLIYLALALLRCCRPPEESLLLSICYLLPVAALQQASPDERYLVQQR